MAKIIAIANQKGGVGKTTATVNLGAALAKLGERTLVVDNDPQSNLTLAFGINPAKVDAGTDALYDGRPPRIYKNGTLSVIASAPGFVATGLSLSRQYAAFPSGVLKQRLAPLVDKYDYILVDCGPSLDMLLLNALVAARYVIAPTLCQEMATLMLAGFEATIEDIKGINPSIELLGVLPMAYVSGETHEVEQLAALRARYGDRVFCPIARKTEYKKELKIIARSMAIKRRFGPLLRKRS